MDLGTRTKRVTVNNGRWHFRLSSIFQLYRFHYGRSIARSLFALCGRISRLSLQQKRKWENRTSSIELLQRKIYNSIVQYHFITRRIRVAASTSRWRYENQTYCSNRHLKSFQKHFQRYWIYWEKRSARCHVSKRCWMLARSLSIENCSRYFSNNSLFIFQISNIRRLDSDVPLDKRAINLSS